jgi:hypothetical protein
MPEHRHRRLSPGPRWRACGGLIQASRLSFVCHPVQGFPPLTAHAGLIGQKVGKEGLYAVVVALLIRDLAILEQPYQRGPGDAEQLGGLPCGQQRILRDNRDTLAVGHGRCHVNQGIEHRPWYLEAAAVGSNQGRLGFRNGLLFLASAKIPRKRSAAPGGAAAGSWKAGNCRARLAQREKSLGWLTLGSVHAESG